MHMIVRERTAKKKDKISIVDIYIEQSGAIKVMLKVGLRGVGRGFVGRVPRRGVKENAWLDWRKGP